MNQLAPDWLVYLILYGGIAAGSFFLATAIFEAITEHERLYWPVALAGIGLILFCGAILLDYTSTDYLNGWHRVPAVCVHEETGALAPCDEVRR